MDKKSNVAKEYLKKGRLSGYAPVILSKELKKAERDKEHVLWPVVSLRNEHRFDEATKLLGKIILNAEEDSPLRSVTSLLAIYAEQEALKYAEKNANNPDTLMNFPSQVLVQAGINLGLKESKAAGGRNKGKVWKEKIISEWEKSKKASIPAFATRFFETYNGSYDENGVKIGKVPSPRTIEKHIREHQRK